MRKRESARNLDVQMLMLKKSKSELLRQRVQKGCRNPRQPHSCPRSRRPTFVTGTVELPSGTEMVMPGDNIGLTVNLISPIAMQKGLKFAIREGGKTVGAGVVAEIIE